MNGNKGKHTFEACHLLLKQFICIIPLAGNWQLAICSWRLANYYAELKLPLLKNESKTSIVIRDIM